MEVCKTISKSIFYKCTAGLVVLFLFIMYNIQAQKSDSLWSVFNEQLEIQVAKERKRGYFDDNDFAYCLSKTIINTPVEKKAVKFLADTYRADTLPNVRDLVRKMMEEIAKRSNDSISRKIAIHYILDTSLTPDLVGCHLKDFDDTIKQKVVQLYNRKPSKELSFLIETDVQRDMRFSEKWYNRQIDDSIKKYMGAKSYEEIRREIFQFKILEKMNTILASKPSSNIMLISGQLNLSEIVPYLKEYANDSLYHEKEYAIYALAIMRVEDYEDRAVVYFDIDNASYDTWLAKIINSQKIWYAYMRRLKSEKYNGFCPVAYSTIRALGSVLKDFPITDRPWYERWGELDNGMKIAIPSKIEPIFIVQYPMTAACPHKQKKHP